MGALPPEIEAMVATLLDQAVSQYESTLKQKEEQIAELQDRLRVFSDGRNISVSDYQRIEQDLRAERDEKIALQRSMQDLESKLSNQASKMASLEQQLQRQNTDMSFGTQLNKQKENQIGDLQQQLSRLETTTTRQRAEILQHLNDKKSMNEAFRMLKAQNDEMTQAIEDLLARDHELSEALNERSDRVAELEQQLDEQQRRAVRVEGHISKLKSKGVSGAQSKLFEKEAAVANEIQKQYITAREANKELKTRIFKLEEEARRATRLQTALETKTKQVEKLQQILDENEIEMQTMQQSVEDFSLQIETYREKLRMTTEMADEQLASMREELKNCQTRSDLAIKRASDLEEFANEHVKEITELRERIKKYEESIFGLPEAVDELKELRGMVDLRDRHISELVQQLNTMDKIITGLVHESGNDFDAEAFLARNEAALAEEEEKRTQLAVRELEAKINAMRESVPIRTIKLEVNEGIREQTESVIVPKQKTKKVQQSPEAQKFKPKEVRMDFAFENLVVCSIKDQPMEVEEHHIEQQGPERDEWVRDLQKNYVTCQKQRKALVEKNEAYRFEIEQLYKEIDLLKQQIDELGYTTPKSNVEISTPIHTPSVITVNASTQVSAEHFITEKRKKPAVALSPSMHFDSSESKVKLLISKSSVYPSQSQISASSERQNALNEQNESLRAKIASLTAQIEAMVSEANTRQQMIVDSDETIAKLEKQLADQRSVYKERLLQIKADADNYVEARIEEEKRLRGLSSGKGEDLGDFDRLDNILKKQKELGQRNELLEQQLKDTRERMQELQNENISLIQRSLESDSQQRKPSASSASEEQHEKLRQYCNTLKMKFSTLEKKYNVLKEEYKHIKRQMDEERHESSSYEVTENQTANVNIASKLKRTQAQLEELKTQNAEIQLSMNRDKSTIERLTQLLQKKESHLARLQSQLAVYKQQDISKTKNK